MILQLLLLLPLVKAQFQDLHDGLVAISDARRIRVTVTCDVGRMIATVTFLQPFADWMVVGSNQRDECRVKGNGGTIYTIPILTVGGPCMTKMIQTGVYENSISVRTNPLLVLQGDEQVLLRCNYNLDSNQNGAVWEANKGLSPPPVFNGFLPDSWTPQTWSQAPIPVHNYARPTEKPKMATETIYLIVFLVLFLLLLLILCCCVWVCMRNKKNRELRQANIIANGHIPETPKPLLWDIWSQSKQPKGVIGGDFMISTGSTAREELSVSSDYMGESTSSSSGSPTHGDDSYDNKGYIHDTKHMLPAGKNAPDKHIHPKSIVHPMKVIPEENNPNSTAESPSTASGIVREYSQWRKDVANNKPVSSTPINKGPPTLPKTIRLERSISEPQTTPEIGVDQSDTISRAETTIIPADRGTLTSAHRQAIIPIVGLKLYKASMGKLNNSHVDIVEQNLSQSSSKLAVNQYNKAGLFDPQDELYSAVRSQKLTVDNKSDTNGYSIPQANLTRIGEADWSEYQHAVESLKGDNSNQLNEDELITWGNLISGDSNIRTIIRGARNIEDFENLSKNPRYEALFSQEKWASIALALARVAFVQRLNDIIDSHSNLDTNQSGSEAGYTVVKPTPFGTDPSTPDFWSSAEYKQQLRKVEPTIFTDPPIKSTEKPVILRHSDDGSFRERSVSEVFEHPPTLNVYMGNVGVREIKQSVTNEDPDGLLHSIYEALPGDYKDSLTGSSHIQSAYDLPIS